MHTSLGRPGTAQLPSGRARNRLLAALASADFEHLRRHLELVVLQRGLVLQELDQAPERVYFIESGLTSLQVQTGKDNPIEVGLVGRMGLVGAPAVLETSHVPIRAVVQIAGEALAMWTDILRDTMARSPPLRRLLLSYLQAISVQTSQLVLCNARHETEQRVARWLLLAHDWLDTDEIPITHRALGSSLGVRRPSVTDAIHRLQDAGVLHTQRACISVVDRQRLKERSCDCYHVISREYARLFERNIADRNNLLSGAPT